MTTNTFQANSRLSVWPKLLNIIAAYHHKVVQRLGKHFIINILFQQNRATLCLLGASYMVPLNVFVIRIFCFAFLDFFANYVFLSKFSAHSSELPSWEWAHTVGKQSCIYTPLELLGRTSLWDEEGGVQNERGRDRVCQKRLEKKNEETVQHSSDQSQGGQLCCGREVRPTEGEQLKTQRTVKVLIWCLTYWWGPIKKTGLLKKPCWMQKSYIV